MGGPHHDLDPRLEALAVLVLPGQPMVDVGTDHARLPTALVARGLVPSAIASDIAPGPLRGASARIDSAGLTDRIQTRLAAGLEGLRPGEAATAVVAGMGGRRIADILDTGPLGPLARLVVSPHTEVPLVRAALVRNGFAAVRDHVLAIGERFYWLMAAERAQSPVLGAREALVGTVAADRAGPDYDRWVTRELERVDAALSRIQARPQDEDRRRRLNAQRSALVWARTSR